MRNGVVPTVAPRSRRDIEVLAEGFLRRAFPNNLRSPTRLDVIELLEVLQDDDRFDVRVAELGPGIEGITWPNGLIEISESTYRGAVQGHGRDRFTIPHEACHALHHMSEIKSRLIESGQVLFRRQADLPAYLDPEWQANAFASTLLMPESMVRMLFAGRRNLFFESPEEVMMRTFGVSHAAAETRLKVLKIK